MRYARLFFDLDGTLWNFERNSARVLRKLFDEHGLDGLFNGFEEFHALYRQRNDYLWERYAEGKIMRDELEKERFDYPFEAKHLRLPMVADSMREQYLPLLARQKELEPGAGELLECLRSRGYKMYVISNGFREVQYKKLAASGIGGFFDDVFLSEELGAKKPAAAFFEAVMERSGATKRESLVIGDNFRADIAGARDFGIDQIYYAPRGSAQMDFEPTVVVSRLEEICGIL